MSSAAPYQKRKRKRKTRAERNQVSLYLLEQKKQKRLSNYLKDMEPCHNTYYTLRSGRGASHPTVLSRDDTKIRAGSITQGRLTRSLGKLSFPNGKTSDWIRRGPISESEDMKKKVESDIKRILRLAEKSTLTGNSDVGNCCLPDAEKATLASELGQTVMDVDGLNNGSPDMDRNASEVSNRKQMLQESSTAAATTAATSTVTAASAVSTANQPQGTPTNPAADSAVWCSESSNNPDEVLELEPPVQEIADKILEELKPKFVRMFPTRNIEVEICSDLQKLLNRSCCRSQELPDGSATDFFLPEYLEPVNLYTPVPGIPAICRSTLSTCRQARKLENRHFYSQVPHVGENRLDSSSSMLIQESVFCPCVSADSSTHFHTSADASSSFTATFMMQDLPEADDVIKISVNVDESDDEDSDILSTARYNAFLASARELELQQERRIFEGSATSHSYHHCPGQPPLFQLPPELRHENPYKHVSRELDPNFWHLNWRNMHAARVLDFSQPSGDHLHQPGPLSCLSRRFHETLYPNIHLCQPRLNHQGSPLDSIFNGPSSDQPQFSFVNQHSSTVSVDLNSMDKRWSYPKAFLSPVGHSASKSTAPVIGPCLAQSRLNFENAVRFACQPNVSHSQPNELMDMEGCSDFLAGMHCKNSSLQSCDFLGYRQLMTRPLSELQNHQADLQRQARDFLDDLNRCGVNPHHNFLARQSTSSARHLLQIASPDSNGSPVWEMPAVMKDFGLETGGFA